MVHLNGGMQRVVLLYDDDCGLCRWMLAKVLAWDRGTRVRPLPIESAEGAQLLPDLSEEERLRSWHLVAGSARYSAGAAFPPLLRLLPGGRPLAWIAGASPRLTELAYFLVAGNRSRLGRLITAGAKERADKRIAARTG
jgi:predicted DCC family thiol-disulfide oxidoreductase YuxK